MNVLFLTLVSFESLQERNIYTDLLREFVKNDHNVYAISPIEKRYKQNTHLNIEKNAQILRLQIGNTQKTNIIEKGVSTVLIEPMIKKAISQFFLNVKFDLVLYSTPPITFVGAIDYVKKRDKANTYLLLKDIFPQNAIDLGLMNEKGIKSIIYKHFRNKEKKLYRLSDRIGCMSQANVEYIINHNPEVIPEIVEVCPNSIDVIDKSVDEDNRIKIRKRYNIPVDKKVFVYGGNLGKPQGIPFLIECLKKCKDIDDTFFLIVGDGTEFDLLKNYVNICGQKNLKLLKRLPREDYDTMVGACDVGLIFLDHRFTIPNFPSRLLSYMQAKLPVLSVTDPNTDIGKIIENGGFGWWCESNDADRFKIIILDILKQDIKKYGLCGYQYLINHYNTQQAYEIIVGKRG